MNQLLALLSGQRPSPEVTPTTNEVAQQYIEPLRVFIDRTERLTNAQIQLYRNAGGLIPRTQHLVTGEAIKADIAANAAAIREYQEWLGSQALGLCVRTPDGPYTVQGITYVYPNPTMPAGHYAANVIQDGAHANLPLRNVSLEIGDIIRPTTR